MRTQVCITVDTEFSIGGAFADPLRRTPVGEENRGSVPQRSFDSSYPLISIAGTSANKR